MRLNLSVCGWELPSGRNAKGCLEAVKATAGEYQIKKAKGLLFICNGDYCSQCLFLCRCSLIMWFEAKILERWRSRMQRSLWATLKKTSLKNVNFTVPVEALIHTRGFS